MKIVSCLKLKELEESKTVIFDGIRILLKIQGTEDTTVELRDMPFILNRILYTQVGTCLYLGTTEDNITFLYVIEQEIKNNKLSIKNIYTDTIVEDNHLLAKFFRYDETFQRESLSKRLFDTIDNIPVIIDKEYLKGKIQEYLDREDFETPIDKDIIEEIEQDKGIKSISPQPFFKKSLNDESVSCFGKTFNSFNAFTNYYKIPSTSAWTCYKIRGMTPEAIVEKYREGVVAPRTGKPVICNGQTFNSIAKFAEYYKINQATAQRKLALGKTPEKILEEAKESPKGGIDTTEYYEYAGQKLSLTELAKISDVPRSTIYHRIKAGWSVEKAVETPVKGTPSKRP